MPICTRCIAGLWTFVAASPQGAHYEDIASQIDNTLAFMQACGITSETTPQMRGTEFFTSHEALLLPYEQALTRVDSTTGEWYDVSAHFLWIGDRTRQLDGAHIEFMRGIRNPIGLKVGPSMGEDELLRLIEALDPAGRAWPLDVDQPHGIGQRLTRKLAPLMRAVKKSGRELAWICDPMHGNTVKSSSAVTRRGPSIVSCPKCVASLRCTRQEGQHPGGVHFEMTGQDVTECTGGAQAITEGGLSERYHTVCDPRLNASQSLELTFLITDELKRLRGSRVTGLQ